MDFFLAAGQHRDYSSGKNSLISYIEALKSLTLTQYLTHRWNVDPEKNQTG